MNGPAQPGEAEPRGYGPVMTADDGTKYQVTDEDVWNAMPVVAAVLILMAAWDFSRSAEWTLGERHYWFPEWERFLARIAGVAIAAWIMLIANCDAKAREKAERGEAETSELAGRAFVPGKRPGRDE